MINDDQLAVTSMDVPTRRLPLAGPVMNLVLRALHRECARSGHLPVRVVSGTRCANCGRHWAHG